MSAIQTIIETYIRFGDEPALSALRAHRLKLLATIDENDALFRSLRSQCIEEISAIEAGLARLQPPAAPPPDPGPPQAVSPDEDGSPLETTATEPVAGWDAETALAAIASEIATLDQNTSDRKEDAAVPPPVPDSPEPGSVTASTSDPALIASSLLAAPLAARIASGGTNLAAELVKLQLRLTRRLKG